MRGERSSRPELRPGVGLRHQRPAASPTCRHVSHLQETRRVALEESPSRGCQDPSRWLLIPANQSAAWCDLQLISCSLNLTLVTEQSDTEAFTAVERRFVQSSEPNVLPAASNMPIDMALPLYRSKEDFIYRTSPQMCKPAPSSCLRFQRCVEKPEDGRPSRKDSRKAKKQVTFADHRGLALTRVKVFSQFNDPIDVPLNITEMLSSALRLTAQEDTLVLDFTQPSSDYLSFRQSLERNAVCLEHCVLKEKALAGTVKVKNVSFKKSVKLRVTFDSWRSHVDVDCVYVKDTYPSSYSDTFSFHVSLPGELKPHERVEFAVCYEAAGCEHWDNNGGDNYRIVWSSMKRSHTDSFDFGIHFDRYGSPTCSHGIFPDWPSYAGYENTGPYY